MVMALYGMRGRELKQKNCDVRCYEAVRNLKWSDGLSCPHCESKEIIKRGFDDRETKRQRYECKGPSFSGVII